MVGVWISLDLRRFLSHSHQVQHYRYSSFIEIWSLLKTLGSNSVSKNQSKTKQTTKQHSTRVRNRGRRCPRQTGSRYQKWEKGLSQPQRAKPCTKKGWKKKSPCWARKSLQSMQHSSVHVHGTQMLHFCKRFCPSTQNSESRRGRGEVGFPARCLGEREKRLTEKCRQCRAERSRAVKVQRKSDIWIVLK